MISAQELSEMVHACVDGALLLTDEETAFVEGVAVHCASGGAVTAQQVERVRSIYLQLQSRQYL